MNDNAVSNTGHIDLWQEQNPIIQTVYKKAHKLWKLSTEWLIPFTG